MQGDLISKKVVLDFIKEELKQDRPDDFKIRNIERFINDLPTAYDVEKVIEKISEAKLGGRCDAGVVAKEIVRNGGKEQI